MSKTPTVYVVARIGWAIAPRPSEGYTEVSPDLMNTAGEDRRFVPVAAFTTREAAEARMRELELEAARVFNPFLRVGPLYAFTTANLSDFILRLAGIVDPLPASTFTTDSPNRRAWRVWWEEYVPTWSDAVLAKVWDLLDRIRFYEVLEVEAG